MVRTSTIAGRLLVVAPGCLVARSRLACLNAALVLAVDHELAASTFAARIAASVRADPYAVVGAGLGPMAGPLHGRASHLARQLLDEAAGLVVCRPVLADAIRLLLPGIRASASRTGIPRPGPSSGCCVLCPAGREMAVTEDVLQAAQRRAPLQPNIDFAIAALGSVAGMSHHAGEVIFMIARMAGWLAHAIEEYGGAAWPVPPEGELRARI